MAEPFHTELSPDREAELVALLLAGDLPAWDALWHDLSSHTIRPYLLKHAPVALLGDFERTVAAERAWFEQSPDHQPGTPTFTFLRKAYNLVSRVTPWDQQLFRRQILKWASYGALNIAKRLKRSEAADDLPGPVLELEKRVAPVIPMLDDREEIARLREALSRATTEFFALSTSLRDMLVMTLWARDPRTYKELAVERGFCATIADAERIRRRVFESMKYWLRVRCLEEAFEVTVGGPEAYEQKLRLLLDANHKLRRKRERESETNRADAERDVRELLDGGVDPTGRVSTSGSSESEDVFAN